MSCRTRAELLLIASSLILCSASSPEEAVASPLRVAQCRARCIHKFSSSLSSANKDERTPCLQGPDCYMCWENCQLLQANFAVWGAICDERGICFPGCKEACQFHSEASDSQRVPVIQTRGEDVVEAGGGVAWWPSRPGGPYVFVVMRRGVGGGWRQVAMTEAHSARVPDGGLLRVLAVSRRGLATIYSPASSLAQARHVLASLGAPLRPSPPPRPRINTQLHPSTPFSLLDERVVAARRWELREVSLIHQKVVVIAEICWDRVAEAPRSMYFVTWEVDGGGLRGNLFTDSTCVTLSLWPDTVYHIQVELVDSRESVKSDVLVVDTSRAGGVEVDQPRREPAPRGAEPSDAAWGLAAAIVLFFLLLVLGLALSRRPAPARKLLPPPNISRVMPPMISVTGASERCSPHRTGRTLHV